ncbi:MAG: RHS repeat-associated core domain-containing protein [Pseudodesulfovibrio sp.]
MLHNNCKKDRYCRFAYNPATGEQEREWIKYEDGTYEPVRRAGKLSQKWNDQRTDFKWWKNRKPVEWRPEDDGAAFAWNHTLGEESKPADWGNKPEHEIEAGRTPYAMSVDLNGEERIASRVEKIDGRRETWKFGYANAGQLSACISDTGWSQEFEYDDKGRRTRDYEVGRVPLAREFTYGEDNRLLSAGAVSYEHDENGFRTAKRDGDVVTLYAYAPDYRLPHMATVNNVQYTLHYDQVGSLKAVVSETGNVVKTVQYGPFGDILWDSSPGLRVPLGFAGGLYAPHTNLTRFGWRDYDPDTGRWTAQDPIGDAGGDEDWYGYCLDDPMNGVDPMGLWSWGGMVDSVKGWAKSMDFSTPNKGVKGNTSLDQSIKADKRANSGTDTYDVDYGGSINGEEGDPMPEKDWGAGWNNTVGARDLEREKNRTAQRQQEKAEHVGNMWDYMNEQQEKLTAKKNTSVIGPQVSEDDKPDVAQTNATTVDDSQDEANTSSTSKTSDRASKDKGGLTNPAMRSEMAAKKSSISGYSINMTPKEPSLVESLMEKYSMFQDPTLTPEWEKAYGMPDDAEKESEEQDVQKSEKTNDFSKESQALNESLKDYYTGPKQWTAAELSERIGLIGPGIAKALWGPVDAFMNNSKFRNALLGTLVAGLSFPAAAAVGTSGVIGTAASAVMQNPGATVKATENVLDAISSNPPSTPLGYAKKAAEETYGKMKGKK